MITPECRGLRGSEQLVRAFLASEHGFDLNLGTVNESSSHVMGRYAGTVTMGRPPQWVRLRTRGGRHRALVRLAATTAERFYGTVSSWPSPNLAVVDLVNLGPEVDDLARESAGFAPCIRVRDAAYLRWRWLEEPATRWRIRAARDADGGLRGLAVFGARGGWPRAARYRRGSAGARRSRGARSRDRRLDDSGRRRLPQRDLYLPRSSAVGQAGDVQVRLQTDARTDGGVWASFTLGRK